MSHIAQLKSQLNQLNAQVDAVKEDIKIARMEHFAQHVNEIDAQIAVLDKQMAPLMDQKRTLECERDMITEARMKECEHEYIDYRNFDGHRSYSVYRCQVCGNSDRNSGSFNVIKRVYDY